MSAFIIEFRLLITLFAIIKNMDAILSVLFLFVVTNNHYKRAIIFNIYFQFQCKKIKFTHAINPVCYLFQCHQD